MKEIIRKDLLQQRVILLVGAIVLVISAFLPATLRVEFILLPHLIINLVIVVMGVAVVESSEEKNRGYDFLSVLPISKLEVLGSKFGWIYIESLIFSLCSWLVLSIKGIDSTIGLNLLTLISLSFSTTIILGSIFLSGVYILGLKRFTRVMMVLAIAIQFYIFVLGLQSFGGGGELHQFQKAISLILNGTPYMILGIGSLIWGTLLLLTAQFRKRI